LRYIMLLLIPLRLAGLLTLIVLSAVLAAAVMTGPFGVPLIFILMSWFFKYSFVFFDRLVGGRTEAPVLSIEMILASMGDARVLVPLVLVIVAFFASGVGTYLLGMVVATAMAIGAIVWLPAVLAIQGWTGSAAKSLYPSFYRAMVQSLGADYLWIVGCTFVVVIVCVAVPSIVGGVPLILRIGLLLYAWLAVIAVIAGAVHVNRELLAQNIVLIVPQLHPMSDEEVAKLREGWVDSIYAAWRGNAVHEAWQCVTERLNGSREPLEELRWLYGRIASWQPPQFTNRVADEMLWRLLKDARDGEAWRLARERLAIDPSFRPRTKDERSRLAELARQWGDHTTADTLLRDLPD
jgi:hypothetical protein